MECSAFVPHISFHAAIRDRPPGLPDEATRLQGGGSRSKRPCFSDAVARATLRGMLADRVGGSVRNDSNLVPALRRIASRWKAMCSSSMRFIRRSTTSSKGPEYAAQLTAAARNSHPKNEQQKVERRSPRARLVVFSFHAPFFRPPKRVQSTATYVRRFRCFRGAQRQQRR